MGYSPRVSFTAFIWHTPIIAARLPAKQAIAHKGETKTANKEPIMRIVKTEVDSTNKVLMIDAFIFVVPVSRFDELIIDPYKRKDKRLVLSFVIFIKLFIKTSFVIVSVSVSP